MGRGSGFIAMHASLASGQIDICLIPEVSFNLHGPDGVLTHLKHLLETKGSAIICVAEGTGQNFVQKTNATDASDGICCTVLGQNTFLGAFAGYSGITVGICNTLILTISQAGRP
ncbi:ATP-dependent 6-phosphofructokinase [Quillaja saponaria]|uniref:ATP-dependent 6-phosphofructokinase n=1 Tax=Quillaja saponaria TaxID=32244 RepID=A0AAD7PFC0_QUISA|nr:ATP-dependent 6-phosphofructokinase [Quillaja saponaria]